VSAGASAWLSETTEPELPALGAEYGKLGGAKEKEVTNTYRYGYR